MRVRRPLFLSVLAGSASFVLASCGGSSGNPTPSGDAGADASAACATFAKNPFAIDPSGPDTQVHAASAFAGDRVYVVYDRPKVADKAKLDVFLAAFRCDGKSVFAPVRVSDGDGNDVDPQVAVRGDRVVVAYASDSGASSKNLTIHVRTFDRAGTALGGSRIYDGPRKGIAITENAWMTQVTAASTGFDLVGAYGVPEAPAFQAFGARLDGEGKAVGEAIDLGFDASTTQGTPDVVATSKAMFAAFQSEPNQGNGSTVQIVKLDDGASAPTPVGSIPAALAPSLAADGDRVWVAATKGATDTVLWNVSDPAKKPIDLTFGAAPSIALATSGGAIVATAVDASHRQLKIARFDEAGVLSNEAVVVSDVPPYALRLVTVDPAGVFFLAYQDGTAPAFRAKGMFVDLR